MGQALKQYSLQKTVLCTTPEYGNKKTLTLACFLFDFKTKYNFIEILQYTFRSTKVKNFEEAYILDVDEIDTEDEETESMGSPQKQKIEIPCIYCNRKFLSTGLDKHEQHCEVCYCRVG